MTHSKTNNASGLNVSNSLITNNTVLGSGANVFDTSGDMICDQCTFQSNNGNNINIVSWEAVNSFNNTRQDQVFTFQDNKSNNARQNLTDFDIKSPRLLCR